MRMFTLLTGVVSLFGVAALTAPEAEAAPAVTNITVLNTRNVQNSDGWQVVSYRADPACTTIDPAPRAVPYAAYWRNVNYFGAALGAQPDHGLDGAGCYRGDTFNYNNAPNRWVMQKTFNSPSAGTATVRVTNFGADGGARVRINGTDAGVYAQWDRPAVDGTVQIPVRAGANTIQIEDRDLNGPNGVWGRIDLEIVHDGNLRVQKTSNATEDARPGDVITYTVRATNPGPGVYTAQHPAGVVDDLRTVLDDATYNNDARASGGRPVRFANQRLSWFGPLNIGQTVTITYSVTLTDNGDGNVRNVAFGPDCALNNPSCNPPPPACDPPNANGQDPATGVPCAEVDYKLPKLRVDKTSDRTEDTKPGDTVTYTVTGTNVGPGNYTDTAPAVVVDDLTGVLDDATYNDDAAADQDGDLSYGEPQITWSGALASGESVTFTYTVRLTADGDGIVRNVAFRPSCNPEDEDCDPEPPACDPPDENGKDPETGEPCAIVEYPLPRLVIDKEADKTELPKVGETVTYTVTATNVGPGNYTEGGPAVVTDDLSDVLDDATFDEDSLSASVDGELSFEDNNTVVWSGPLAAEESVQLTYTVTYTGEGDHLLINNACVPEEDVAPGEEPCVKKEIPAAFVVDWKTVEATDDPAVAGTVLTFTAHFENIGKADGTVDRVDNLVHVLDDADITAEPKASSNALEASRDGDTISITGTLAPGQHETVTYKATTRADGKRGDDIAANYLLNPGEDPPKKPVCEPEDEEMPDCTATPIEETPALPDTGANSVGWATAAVALLLTGAGLVTLTWRRRLITR